MDSLLDMFNLVRGCEYEDSLLGRMRALDEKVCALEKLTGVSIDVLILMISRGYVLVPGTTNTSMSDLLKGE